MTISDPYGKLGRLIKQGRFSLTEKRRAILEMQVISERLSKRQYRISSFTSNRFNLPDRADDFFKELEFHCLLGRTWEAMFRSFGLKRQGDVVDVCPGASPKVELGLFYYGFKGKVFALDKDSRAMRRLQSFVSLFRPAYTFVPIKTNFYTFGKRQFEVVLANHFLDDLCVDLFLKQSGMTPSELYHKEENMRHVWRAILQDRSKYFALFAEQILPVLARLTKPGGVLFISQYKSYIEKILGLKEVTRFNAKLLQHVRETLCRDFAFRDSTARVVGMDQEEKRHFSSKHCVVLVSSLKDALPGASRAYPA